MKSSRYRQENLDEYQEHKAVVEWILFQYPGVRFLSNEAGHGKPTRAVHLQDGRSWPDLCILERRPTGKIQNRFYPALWLEIKTGIERVFEADGVTFLNDHIKRQWDMILWLRSQGYAANWGLGFEDCQAQIVAYLDEGKVLY